MFGFIVPIGYVYNSESGVVPSRKMMPTAFPLLATGLISAPTVTFQSRPSASELRDYFRQTVLGLENQLAQGLAGKDGSNVGDIPIREGENAVRVMIMEVYLFEDDNRPTDAQIDEFVRAMEDAELPMKPVGRYIFDAHFAVDYREFRP